MKQKKSLKSICLINTNKLQYKNNKLLFFFRRDKVLNKFNIMIQKRLKNEEDEEINEYNDNQNKSGEKRFKTKG